MNDDMCPFCQQSTAEAFAHSLNEYFDEVFVADSKAIDNLATDYATDAVRLQQEIAAIIAAPSNFLEVEKLKTEQELLGTKITINIQRLAGKRKEASQVVELESVGDVAAAIKGLIDTANTQITAHNKMSQTLRLSAEP